MQRRDFLTGAAGLLGLAACADIPNSPISRETGYPFTLGVASGEPTATGMILWTRIVPDPFDDDKNPRGPVPVMWEIAEDYHLTKVVRSGTVDALPEDAHSLHIEVEGLLPNRWYFYRFRALGEASPTGRTRTTPLPGSKVSRLRLAYASCQHYEFGYYTALADLTAFEPDIVLHLGDYIYETAEAVGGNRVRRHVGGEARTLADYRRRYSLYKLDPHLKMAHASAPWMAMWDDHDVQDDYAADQSRDKDDPAAFLKRRAAAYQAYWEHMPLSPAQRPVNGAARLYRRLSWGNLADLHLLDTRQYRSDQACGRKGAWGGQLIRACRELYNPRRTMLGAAQEKWLARDLARAKAPWNLIAQPQMMAPLTQRKNGRPAIWSDGWDGYPAARRRLLQQLARRNVRNPIVFSGDIHSFWANELRLPERGGRIVATEFVGSSISSPGVPYGLFEKYAKANRHVRFFDSRYRGYVRCTISPERCVVDFRSMNEVASPHGEASTLASFFVENGRPGMIENS